MRARGRAARRLTCAVIAAASSLSCVSERATGTAPDPSGCDVALPPEAFGSTIVIVRDFTFTPAQVRVRPGTKVTWVNCDAPGAEAHTSTGDNGNWGSALLPPGATYTHEFPTAGSQPYHCEPHPGMTAMVTVE